MTIDLWSTAVNQMLGNLVRIETHGVCYGSGFIIQAPTNTSGNCCVLTAYHVIKKAHETGATITIMNSLGKRIDLPSLRRNIFTLKGRDQAIINFDVQCDFDSWSRVNFVMQDSHCNPGIELGWLGFPNLDKARGIPCFFSGRISTYLPDEEAYLIDGVSIHGVSGGPAFYYSDDGILVIAGIVTNYYPNEVNNQVWPGLAMFRTVNPLLELYKVQDNSPIPHTSPTPTDIDTPQNGQ